jgi:colanic acid/amylovoran biosynthesis glycosyltransferase
MKAESASRGATYPLRVAYFINQYPKISHTFIRREILALERRGIDVARLALRGWKDQLIDDEDKTEQRRTRYVLFGGAIPLIIATAHAFLRSPRRFISALRLAVHMSRRADRSIAYHLVYLAEACRMLPWLITEKVGHLHAHFGTNSAEVAMLAHELGGPKYSFTVHGPEEFDKPQELKISEKVKRSAFVVAVSSFGRSQLYRWVEPAQWPKVKVVPCGLDPRFLDVPPVPPPSAPRLVCVGRLCEQKGQLLLVEAAARLAARGVCFELVLAGDGELRVQIEQSIAKHGLSHGIRVTGWISGNEVREEILSARALVLPSFAEGLPVVIMEAMALHRPVVSTYVGGIPELVVPGENGWLVPPGDLQELTRTLEECLSCSIDQLEAMGRAARKRVLERHSIEASAATLSRLFSGPQCS